MQAFRIPIDGPEADGRISWNATTLVLAEIDAGGTTGLGYSYADAAVAEIVRGTLAEIVVGQDAFDIPRL